MNKHKSDNVDNLHNDIDIDMTDLERKDEDKLIKIAKSIGLSKISKEYSKSKIIKKIKRHTKKQEKKSIVQKQSKSESLFWKLFKSKVLFKHIMSFLNSDKDEDGNGYIKNYGYGKEYFKYKEIIHVKWILGNNHIGLLIDKVKRSEYLVGGEYNHHYSIENQDSSYYNQSKVVTLLRDIITHKNSVGLDITFYGALFNNYKDYIVSIDSLVDLVIGFNRSNALQVLLNHPFNYTPNVYHHLKSAIESSSFKCMVLIINNLTEVQKQQVATIKLDSSFNPLIEKTTLKSCKITSHLISLDIINLSNKEDKKTYFKYLEINLLSFYKRNTNWLKLKLKDIFKLCNLIILLKRKSNKLSINKLKEFEKIQSNFKIDELKSNLKSIMDSCSGKEDTKYSSVKKLIELYLSVVHKEFKFDGSLFDYFYGIRQEEEGEEIHSLVTYPIKESTSESSGLQIQFNRHLLIQSLKYGCSKYWIDLNLLKRSKNLDLLALFFKKESSYSEKYIIKPNQTSLLFKYCRNDKDKQTKFINGLTDHIIKLKSKSRNNQKEIRIQAFILLYLAIGTNDLSLVKHTYEKLKSCEFNFKSEIQPIRNSDDFANQCHGYDSDDDFSESDYEDEDEDDQDFEERNSTKPVKCKFFYIQNFIQSIEMLDYCYSKFKIQFHLNDNWSLNNVYRFKSLELLNRYHQLLDKKKSKKSSHGQKKQNVSISKFMVYKSSSKESIIEYLNIINYIICNEQSKYHIGDVLDLDDYEEKGIGISNHFNGVEFNQLLFPIIKSLIENMSSTTQQSNFKIYPTTLFNKPYQIIQLLNWLVLTNNLKCCKYNFKNNVIDSINFNDFSKDSKIFNYLKWIASTGNTKLLKQWLNNTTSIGGSFKDYIETLLTYASKYGYLNILKCLYKSKISHSTLVNFQIPAHIIQSSFVESHLKIIDFIFGKLNFKFSKKEIDEYKLKFPLISKIKIQ